MAIAASGQGGVLVRVDPEKSDHLIDTTKAEVAVMRDRPMSGWLRVAPDDIVTKRQLGKWVDLGLSYARSLPKKKKKKKEEEAVGRRRDLAASMSLPGRPR